MMKLQEYIIMHVLLCVSVRARQFFNYFFRPKNRCIRVIEDGLFSRIFFSMIFWVGKDQKTDFFQIFGRGHRGGQKYFSTKKFFCSSKND